MCPTGVPAQPLNRPPEITTNKVLLPCAGMDGPQLKRQKGEHTVHIYKMTVSAAGAGGEAGAAAAAGASWLRGRLLCHSYASSLRSDTLLPPLLTLLLHQAGGQQGLPPQDAPATAAQVTALAAQVTALAAQVTALADQIAARSKVVDARAFNSRARSQNMAKLAAGAAFVPLQKEKEPAAGGPDAGTLPAQNLFPADKVAAQKVRGDGPAGRPCNCGTCAAICTLRQLPHSRPTISGLPACPRCVAAVRQQPQSAGGLL